MFFESSVFFLKFLDQCRLRYAILFVKIEIKSAHCLMICTRVPRARFCRVFHYVLVICSLETYLFMITLYCVRYFVEIPTRQLLAVT